MATLDELLKQAMGQAPANVLGAAAASPAPTQTQSPAEILASAGMSSTADQAQAAQTPVAPAGAVDFAAALKAYLQRAGVDADPLAAAKGSKVLGQDVNLSGNDRSGSNYQTVRAANGARYHVYYDANGKRRVYRVAAPSS